MSIRIQDLKKTDFTAAQLLLLRTADPLELLRLKWRYAEAPHVWQH